MLFNIIGLSIDLIGVLLLFKFGILPDNLWNHLLMDGGMKEKDERRHRIWSKIAVSFLIVGFGLQLFGTVQQNSSNKTPEKDTIRNVSKIKSLPDDKNLSTEAIGKLKLKYEDEKLFYQLEVNVKLQNTSNLEEFIISFSDADGFEISELNLPLTKFSSFTSNGIMSLSSKGNLKMKKNIFDKIAKWDLKTYKSK
ncbi:MAG: hypothetical protein EOO99_11840 [Pedobacter sp.]|nr:MAG: hypothetical protein EOO99_11840 [Pedobacter sp.]